MAWAMNRRNLKVSAINWLVIIVEMMNRELRNMFFAKREVTTLGKEVFIIFAKPNFTATHLINSSGGTTMVIMSMRQQQLLNPARIKAKTVNRVHQQVEGLLHGAVDQHKSLRGIKQEGRHPINADGPTFFIIWNGALSSNHGNLSLSSSSIFFPPRLFIPHVKAFCTLHLTVNFGLLARLLLGKFTAFSDKRPEQRKRHNSKKCRTDRAL